MTFVREPVLEITYDAVEELTIEEFERRKESQYGAYILSEAKGLLI